MIYSEEFKKKVAYAQNEIKRFIKITEEQGVKDQLIYSFKDGFEVLNNFIKSRKKMDELFIRRWNVIHGHAFRSFEEHPFLDVLDDIHKDIHLIYTRSAKSG